MKPETTEDILELLNGYIISAALGAAMELGVFWLLAEKPLSAPNIAQSLNIPLNRCHHWLQLLCKLGLLEDSAEGYTPSIIARKAILNAQSQDTWAFQAREDRDSSLFVRDLALNISKPMSTWQTRNLPPPDYLQRIKEDPSYAARFTRKLYEIHCPLAEQLANMLDLRGVKSLLDLGGGSGVVSFALLRKQHDLTSVVVDVENVCQAGREIASENKLEKRITYLAADFLQDDLPTGFDMVMLCDVGSFSEILFRRIYDVLNLKGHLVIVDKFAPSRTSAPPSRLLSAFLDSLEYPAQSIDFTTTEVVQTRLQQAGFRDFSASSVPHKDNLPWNIDWIMLEARKKTNAFLKSTFLTPFFGNFVIWALDFLPGRLNSLEPLLRQPLEALNQCPGSLDVLQLLRESIELLLWREFLPVHRHHPLSAAPGLLMLERLAISQCARITKSRGAGDHSPAP